LPDYGLDRSKIGPPDVVLRPGVGDLIVFDTGRIHAVRRVADGVRITASCFIGVRSRWHPLCVFA
jgi:hypothetical protein